MPPKAPQYVTAMLTRDVRVEFPCSPYPQQVDFMRCVYSSIQDQHHALLESPTGTGKTLALLCGACAYVTAAKLNLSERCGSGLLDCGGSSHSLVPKIIYTSRTHAQLAQVVREFKKTSYSAVVKMAILGSREHLCVNPAVTKLPNAMSQTAMCNTLRSDKECPFYSGLQPALNREMQQYALGEVLQVGLGDIEELMARGKKERFCPYFYERERVKDADIVFMPYSYVFDVALHKQLPVELQDAVLIVDEAHNLPSVLSSEGVSNVTPTELSRAIEEASRAAALLKQKVANGEAESDHGRHVELTAQIEMFSTMKLVLCELETRIAAEGPDHQQPQTDPALPPAPVVQPGAAIFPVLEAAKITRRTAPELQEMLTVAVTLLSQSGASTLGLSKLQTFLAKVFASDLDDVAANSCCRYVLQPTIDPKTRKRVNTIGFWCLDVSFALQHATKGVRCMILTSGTLSPLESFAAELSVHFPIQLVGAHVVEPDHIGGVVLSRGPTGEELNGKFSFRHSANYRYDLGLSIVNMAQNVPGGLIVFFPSYAAMHESCAQWKTGMGRSSDGEKTIWGMLSEVKPIFVEPVDSAELQAVVMAFQEAADRQQVGAVLFAVCRGKVSEGVDFADNHGRCVLVTGIPFANTTDLLIKLKKEYITSISAQRPRLSNGSLFTGDVWYRQEALRSVNQCIGRIIRHQNDYGFVVLADQRFSAHLESLSPWLRKAVVVQPRFGPAFAAVARFFARFRTKASIPPPLLSSSPNADGSSPTTAQAEDGMEEARRYADEQRAVFLQAQCELRRQQQDEHRRCPKEHHNELPAFQLTRQAPPQTMTLAVAAPVVRESVVDAKEFCARVKLAIPPVCYSSFRHALLGIAGVVKEGLNKGNNKQLLSDLFTTMEDVFEANLPEDLAQEFLDVVATFIPQQYHSSFAEHREGKKRRVE